MNFRTTYILFGLIAVVVGIFIITTLIGPSTKDTDKHVFPSLNDKKAGDFKTDEIDQVEIDRSGSTREKLVFTRNGGTKRWKVNDYRADKNAVQNLIQQVVTAKKAVSEEPRSLADWGLDPPRAVVTLKRGDKPNIVLNVGNVSLGESDAVVYVTSSERPKDAMAVPKAQLENVLLEIGSYRERELLTPAASDIQSVKLMEGGKVVALEKASDGSWKYTEPFQGSVETSGTNLAEEGKPPSNMQALLHDLSSLTVETDDFVKDDVTGDDLATYHLGPKDEVLKLTIKRDEVNLKPTELTLRIGVSKTVHTKPDDKIEKYYAVLEGENTVVRIPAKKVAAIRELLKKPDALRDRHLVKAEGSKQPDVIRIRNGSGVIEFFKGSDILPLSSPFPHEGLGARWKMYRDDKEVPIDPSLVSTLVRLLTDASVESFPDPKQWKEADLGVADEKKAEAVVELWVDGIAPDEKKDEKKDDKKDEKKDEKKGKPKLKSDKPTFTLVFGKKGPDKTVAVKRTSDEEKNGTLLWVKEIVQEKVAAKAIDYMDRKLPAYSDLNALTGVTKVELTRPGKDGKPEEWVIVREKDGTPWKIEKPETLKGREADRSTVEMLLQRINFLAASTLESEKATDDALENIYGLGKSTSTKVVVTVTTKVMDKDETKTYEYRFGKDKDDTHIYAKQGWRDMIFTVDKKKDPVGGIVNDLQTKELLDLTVVTFDQTKLKAIKMVGWFELDKSPYTLELEMKNGQWTVKTPTGRTADTLAVNRLVSTLANLRADRFAAHNVKELDPSYGFDLNKDALHITLTFEGDTKPIELKLGKLDGDKYYGASTSAPGDLFLVPAKPLFEDIRKKPAYFYGQ